MKTDDEIIDEFMGVYIKSDTRKYNCFYKTDWNKLMEVVKKIDRWSQQIPVKFPEFNEAFKVIGLKVNTPINEVYKAVVEFIKWYNSQTALDGTKL